MLLTALQDLATIYICLRVPEVCRSESMSQRAGSLKQDTKNVQKIHIIFLCMNYKYSATLG